MEIFGSSPTGPIMRTMIIEERRDNIANLTLIPHILTIEQLYLRDKELFFQNNPIKITPYSEILEMTRKLTLVNIPNPT